MSRKRKTSKRETEKAPYQATDQEKAAPDTRQQAMPIIETGARVLPLRAKKKMAGDHPRKYRADA